MIGAAAHRGSLRRLFFFLSLLLMLHSVVGCRRTDEPGEVVSEVAVQRADITDSVVAPGSIQPDTGSQVQVGARISGRVKRLFVRKGDVVQAGDLIAELEDEDLVAQLAEASIARAEQESVVRLLSAKLRRRSSLAGEGLISTEDLETSAMELERAKATLNRLESEQQRSRVLLSYTAIRAPISGIVTRVSTQEGETIAATFATPTLVTILDPTGLIAEALIDEIDLERVHVGQSAKIQLDALPSVTLQGTVRTISFMPVGGNGPVRFSAFIDLEAAEQVPLRPQLTATVTLAATNSVSALVLQRAAIRRDATGFFVETRAPGGGFEIHRVSLGAVIDGMIEIEGDIEEGQIVVVRGGSEEK